MNPMLQSDTILDQQTRRITANTVSNSTAWPGVTSTSISGYVQPQPTKAPFAPYEAEKGLRLYNDADRMTMLAFRLRIEYGNKFPFDYLNTHLGKEMVFVFVVQGDKPVVLEDSIEMFPSDTLVTQLRLLMK